MYLYSIDQIFVSDVCNGFDEPPDANIMCGSPGGDMDYDDDLPCSPLGVTEVGATSHGVQLRERKEDFKTQYAVEQKVFRVGWGRQFTVSSTRRVATKSS
jgi:hypothetical protein